MDGHANINAASTSETTAGGTAAKRDQSTIGFPYNDLEAAIGIAKKLHESGGVPVSRDQLAAALGLSQAGGNFVTRVATARLFGLVDFAQSKFSLTELGYAILDPAREKGAKAEAFLNVPLFKRTYEEFRGKQLPPRPLGIEAAFVKFGVAPKQKDKARVAFDKSAAQAGYFGAGNDRLVEPIIPNQPSPQQSVPQQKADAVPPATADDTIPEKVRVTWGGRKAYHPFVQGLLDTMPEPGAEWPKKARELWLTTAGNIFAMIYKDGDAKEEADGKQAS